MHNCPTCNSNFSTEMGVKVHYGQVHEGSLSGYDAECSYCGSEITLRQQDRLEGNHFCDRECMGKHKTEIMEQNHNKIVSYCSNCDTEIRRWPSQMENKKNVFCNNECQSEWRSENLSGEDNPNYSGGVFEHQYGAEWSKYRERALKRSKEKCEHPDCEREQSDSDYSLDVHHIIPRRYHDKPNDANYMENLLVLCRKHHRKIEPES